MKYIQEMGKDEVKALVASLPHINALYVDKSELIRANKETWEGLYYHKGCKAFRIDEFSSITLKARLDMPLFDNMKLISIEALIKLILGGYIAIKNLSLLDKEYFKASRKKELIKEAVEYFSNSYSYFYDGFDNVSEYDEAFSIGEDYLQQHGKNAFMTDFVKYRADYITSDREVAALGMVIKKYGI